MEIQNLKQVNAGAIKATFDLRLNDDITIGGFKIIQQNDQDPWVGAPSRDYVDKQGKRAFSPIVILSKKLMNEIREMALGIWNSGV